MAAWCWGRRNRPWKWPSSFAPRNRPKSWSIGTGGEGGANPVASESDFLVVILTSTSEGFHRRGVAGRFLEVNEACCRMLGCSREELLNMSIRDVEADGSPEGIARTLEAILQEGMARRERRQRR